MKYPDCRLLVFSKAPVPGQVKTRLVPFLGAQGAADFYAALIHRCLEKADKSGLCPIELWCSPSRQHPFFRACQERYRIDLYDQSGADLGQRMHHALNSALGRSESAVLIGADSPSLGIADLDQAFAALQQDTEAVLGPTRDGGYCLIGVRETHMRLFSGIQWGTPGVCQDTLRRLEQLGLRYICLTEQDDVDTPADYLRLQGACRT